MKRVTRKIVSMVLAALLMANAVPTEFVMAAEPSTVQSAESVQPEEGVSGEEVQPEESVSGEEAQPEEDVSEEETQSEEAVTEEVGQQEELASTGTVLEEKDTLLNYVFVENPYITAPDSQNIMASVGTEATVLESAVLQYRNIESGEAYEASASMLFGNTVLFSINHQEQQAAGYELTGMLYTIAGKEYTIDFIAAGMDMKYGVNKEVETTPDDVVVTEDMSNLPEVEANVVTTDEAGQVLSENDIKEAIENGQSAVSGMQAADALAKAAKQAENGNLVVVLDPGHDSSHGGTNHNGCPEEELVLKIAQYCKAELEKYNGVTVYMTRDGMACPNGGRSVTSAECNAKRVEFAIAKNADVYVSFHLNYSPSASANGAGVYYPNNNYRPDLGEEAKQLALRISEELSKIGLGKWAGGVLIHNSEDNTLYPDGSLADYLGVIRRCKEAGIPAVLIEHAFVSNQGDVNNFLNSDAKLQKLGIADATAIADAYGLNSGKLELNGICYIWQNDRIDVGVDYLTNGNNVRFKWQAYNLNTQQWTEICNWYGGNWVSWRPEPGDYWLNVQATTDEGYIADYTMCFHVEKNYSPYAFEPTGICYIQKDDGIDIGVAYDSNDKNLEFRWLSYNLDTQQWEEISNWFAGNWANWKPKKGNYWLQAQIKNSIGEVKTYTICYYNDKNYVVEPLTINGIVYDIREDSVECGVLYTAQEQNAEFRWTAYNLDTQTWEFVCDWNGGSWISWKPGKGNYWVRVEGRTPDGTVKEYISCFSTDKDYQKKTIDITGVSLLEDRLGYKVNVSYQTNSSAAKFKYSILDLNTMSWSELSDWTTADTVLWDPEPGSYWVYVEAVTEDGVTSDMCIGRAVESRYEIMGASSVTAEQLVRYYNANQAYPEFYATSDAPTIEAFCQIYMEECAAEGVKAEVAFCQAMKETGFMRYLGDVRIDQFNFAGIGATGGGEPGNRFMSVREGVRAQIQHLKAYASQEPLNNPCVDPRFQYVKRGTTPYVEWLGIQENPGTVWGTKPDGSWGILSGVGWATAKNYGYSVRKDYMKKLFTY